jgi:hypothetical protein
MTPPDPKDLDSSAPVRIQFELSQEGAKELDDLLRITGVRTKKDLVNNALTLLKWAVKETRNGNMIAAVDDKKQTYKELAMPVLQGLHG